MRIPRPRRPSLETIHPDSAASFKVFRFVQSSFPFSWHYHPEVELTWIVRGSGLRFVGDSIEPYGPDDLILIGTGVPHTWQSVETDHSVVESVVVQFKPDLWREAGCAMPEFRNVSALLSRAARGLRVVDAELTQRVARLLSEMNLAKPLALGRYHGLLRALDALAEADEKALVELSAGERRPHDDHDDVRLQTVLERLQESLPTGHALTQSEAADLAGMSQASFSRFFHGRVGRPFVRYVNEWRVGLACRALVQSDRSITDIAFDCGFGNLSNFNRRFKQIKGITPREFRAYGT